MTPASEMGLDHETLDVYQDAVPFVAWLSDLLDGTARLREAQDQLDRAATSATLNSAEGNGKYMPGDRCRLFDTAHGSALEGAAGLDVVVAQRKLDPDQGRPGKDRLQRIVRMLLGLIERNSERGYDKVGATRARAASITCRGERSPVLRTGVSTDWTTTSWSAPMASS